MSGTGHIRILFLGDIVGKTGRSIFKKHIKQVRETYQIDAVVVNGENSSADGRGITPDIADFFKSNGVNVITSGNHIWHKKEIYPYLDEHAHLIRPANFPSDAPGSGVAYFMCKTYRVAIVNLQGSIFMREHLACPFASARDILLSIKEKADIICVDFHAEATSEKMGLAYFLDGRISAIVGTHTHVQTADERILPFGTAYITDLGMAGSLNSMIGMKKESVMKHFITQMPSRFIVDTQPPFIMTGVYIDIDYATRKAVDIKRIKIEDTEHI